MIFTLTMVRHGESEANVKHMLSGWMDVRLTENGIKELKELRERALYPPSDIYYSSSLKRCIDTSHILFPDKEIIISDLFKEINFRSLEGHVLKTEEDALSYFNAWADDKTLKDEERLTDVMRRGHRMVIKTMNECLNKGLRSALITTHSGIMRASIVSLFNLDHQCFNTLHVPNGLGYIIKFDDLLPLSFSPIALRNEK